jgi:hypothetical protein
MFLNIGVGISTFVTNFNTIVSTFRDWFLRVRMSACGRRILFPHSRGTALVSVWSETLPSIIGCNLCPVPTLFAVTELYLHGHCAFWGHFVLLTDESHFRFQSHAAQYLALPLALLLLRSHSQFSPATKCSS